MAFVPSFHSSFILPHSLPLPLPLPYPPLSSPFPSLPFECPSGFSPSDTPGPVISPHLCGLTWYLPPGQLTPLTLPSLRQNQGLAMLDLWRMRNGRIVYLPDPASRAESAAARKLPHPGLAFDFR